MSHTGSFVNLRGGHVYPDLVRKTAPGESDPAATAAEQAKNALRRKVRVFLHAGATDTVSSAGNWPQATRIWPPR